MRSLHLEQFALATLQATVANFVEVHDSGKQFRTTLFDHVVNRAVAGVGARHPPGASESEQSVSAQVHIEDFYVGRHGKCGGGGRVPRLIGGR